jgi:hypothetical protein
MIIVYPMLTSPNISQTSLPGIIKAVEKYILVYNLDDVLNNANSVVSQIFTKGESLLTFALAAGAIHLVSKDFKSGGFKRMKEDENLLEQGKGHNKDPRNEPETQATQAASQSAFQPGQTRIEMPRREGLALEPTWVHVNSDKAGTKLLGVKVVPFTIQSDKNIMDMISYDLSLKGWEKALKEYGRKATRLLYSVMRGLNLPFIKDRALTGDADVDIIYAGTKYGKNLFVCLNSIEIEQSDIFSKPAAVQKLHSLGWSSIIIADDVNKKATFCMKEFGGLCSVTPYGLLYSAIGKEHLEVYQDLNDVKHAAGPFFRMTTRRSKVFAETIAFRTINNYLEKMKDD